MVVAGAALVNTNGERGAAIRPAARFESNNLISPESRHNLHRVSVPEEFLLRHPDFYRPVRQYGQHSVRPRKGRDLWRYVGHRRVRRVDDCSANTSWPCRRRGFNQSPNRPVPPRGPVGTANRVLGYRRFLGDDGVPSCAVSPRGTIGTAKCILRRGWHDAASLQPPSGRGSVGRRRERRGHGSQPYTSGA